jgi:glycosyltransferase involved in cell wall biosynthesis
VTTPAEPLVSICIPSYRGAAFLPATIESVLQQTHRNFELWILDDASPDETEAVVRRFADPRIHFVRGERNVGPEENWNRCLRVATGKYYKLLPQDDLLAPGSLAEHVAVLESDVNEELALVFGSRLVIDHNGKPVFRRGWSAAVGERVQGRTLARRCVSAGTNLIGEPGNGLMRRSLTERIGNYSSEHPYMIDLDYWFRALTCGDAFYTAKPSSSFRISRGSWSVRLGRKQLEDFMGFVDKYAADASFGIRRIDKLLGFTRARLNTIGRAMVYRSLLRTQNEGR